METQALERQVGTIQGQAAVINIRDQATYDRTVQLLAVVKSIQDGTEIKEMRASVEAAHEAHSAALKVWHRFWDPLEKIEKLLKSKILVFDRVKKEEEDRKQRALEAAEQKKRDDEARRIRAEADKKAREEAARIQRDRTLTKAEKQATIEDVKASAQVIAEEQIATVHAAPMPTIAPMYDRSTAVSARQNWTAEVTDFKALVLWVAQSPAERLGYLQANEQALRSAAKAMKSMAKIPGVRIYDAGSVAATPSKVMF
jgi:hypothetical protein